MGTGIFQAASCLPVDLVSLRGPLTGKSFMLPEAGRVVLGRSEDANVQIFDDRISRLHCLFERSGGEIFLTDLGSSNGTWVNGRSVSRQVLRQGDSVRLGRAEFEFHCGDASYTATTPAKVSSVSGVAESQPTATMKMLRAAVSVLVSVLEARDPYTDGHSARVSQYAVRVGGGLSLSSEDITALELAGILHDVGKVGVTDSILRKSGSLSPDEHGALRQHPIIGYRILSQIKGAESIARAVLYHHERWDGAGYPRGLRGEKIPLLARILAAADTFDALGSDRPYRRAWHQDKIGKEISRCAGTQLDPKVVDALLRQVDEGLIAAVHDLAMAVTVTDNPL